MHEALVAVAGVLVGSGLTASLLAARLRPEKTETPRYTQEDTLQSSRTAVPEGVEHVMACVPAATMVLDEERRLHYASPEAHRILRIRWAVSNGTPLSRRRWTGWLSEAQRLRLRQKRPVLCWMSRITGSYRPVSSSMFCLLCCLLVRGA